MKKIIAAILCLPLIGCIGTVDTSKLGNFNFPNVNVNEPDVKDVRGLLGKVQISLKDASKEDCLHHAKIYLGLAEFLKHSKAITKTVQLAPPSGLLGQIQTDYGFQIGKNKEFTDLVEQDLTDNLGLKKPRDIDESLRASLIETVTVYGTGALRASRKK